MFPYMSVLQLGSFLTHSSRSILFCYFKSGLQLQFEYLLLTAVVSSLLKYNS